MLPKIPKYCSLCKQEAKIYKMPITQYATGFAHLCKSCLSIIEKYLNENKNKT